MKKPPKKIGIKGAKFGKLAPEIRRSIETLAASELPLDDLLNELSARWISVHYCVTKPRNVA